jgi:hypothetical protein
MYFRNLSLVETSYSIPSQDQKAYWTSGSYLSGWKVECLGFVTEYVNFKGTRICTIGCDFKEVVLLREIRIPLVRLHNGSMPVPRFEAKNV